MKIIIINGSPRRNGATAKLLHGIESELLSKSDVDIEFVNISEMQIKPCSGCMLCYRTGKCVVNDDAEKLSERISQADGIIMGSPTYASNVSGQLKTFIDRGHFVIEQLLRDKYAVTVTTGVNYGSSDANKILRSLMQYSGASVSGSIVCNVPFNSDPCNDKMKSKIHRLSERLYSDIKHRRTYPLQKAFHGIIFSMGIRPFVLSQGEAYQGVLDKWKTYGIK